jgi:hypothetical protein
MHRIFDVLLPVALFGSFGATLYYFTKVLTDYILKKKMIEKGYVNEESQSVFKEYKAENRYSALKWGLIIFSAGIALIIIDSLNVDADSTLPYGIFAVCVSLGFMVYFYITRKETR